MACAVACNVPFQWASLLAVVQAGNASLEGLDTLEPDQQQLAADLRKVCPAFLLLLMFSYILGVNK